MCRSIAIEWVTSRGLAGPTDKAGLSASFLWNEASLDKAERSYGKTEAVTVQRSKKNSNIWASSLAHEGDGPSCLRKTRSDSFSARRQVDSPLPTGVRNLAEVLHAAPRTAALYQHHQETPPRLDLGAVVPVYHICSLGMLVGDVRMGKIE